MAESNETPPAVITVLSILNIIYLDPGMKYLSINVLLFISINDENDGRDVYYNYTHFLVTLLIPNLRHIKNI